MAFSDDTAAWYAGPSARPAGHPVLGTLFMLMGGLGLAAVILASAAVERTDYVRTVGTAFYRADMALLTATKMALLVAGGLLIARRRGAAAVVATALALSAAESALQCFAPLTPRPPQIAQSTYDAAVNLARLLAFVPPLGYGLVLAYLMLPTGDPAGRSAFDGVNWPSGRRAA